MSIGTRVLGDPERLSQLLGIIGRLPEVDGSGDQHLVFRVRKKAFAYFLDDHHGDGIVAVSCKSTFDRQRELVGRHPERYFVPDYVGVRGWVALRLDQAKVDWDEVRELLFAAYRMQAPRRLAEQVE
jgi:hypothetical protein